jgi:hypothetical protein
MGVLSSERLPQLVFARCRQRRSGRWAPRVGVRFQRLWRSTRPVPRRTLIGGLGAARLSKWLTVSVA